MGSTRKYDINHIHSNNFIKIFRNERPNELVQNPKDGNIELMAQKLIKSIQLALEYSTTKLNEKDQKKNGSFYRLPRNFEDLFIISENLLKQNRRKHYKSSNYQNSKQNYSNHNLSEKQLSFYIGDQCSNKLIHKKVTKPAFTPLDKNVIKELIIKLHPNKPPGLDYIPNEIWKCILKYDENYLVQFINTLIESAYFPIAFKQGKIMAFRKSHRSGYHPENYRYITLQSSICKVLEKLIQVKLKDHNLMNYLNKVKNQHGYTKNKSRFTALNTIVNEMKLISETGQYGVVIQLDIKRAFDLISWDHILNIALNNLDNQKFILIAQLLKGRSIKLNESERDLHRGLPQGSASSHLLWLIGTSDLMIKLSTLDLTSVAFVDDLMFVIKGNSVNKIFDKIEKIKSVLEEWLKSAALSLNEKKCYFMQFSGESKIDIGKLEINRVKIKMVNQLKFLGVLLNTELNFHSQILDIEHRIKDAIKALNTIFAYSQRTISYEDRLMIYSKVIKPILMNGWSVWAKEIIGIKHLTDKLRNLQKRCLVLLFNESDYNRNSELCQIHRILPIDIELQAKICEQYATDNYKRRLSKKECQILQVRVMQENYFHW